VIVAMLAIGITKATPLVFGALSGVFSERAGVVNIGIEGMMLTAAFVGFVAANRSGSLFVGVLAAVLAAVVLALLHGILSIRFKVDQIISGTVVNILAVGLTGFFNRQLFATGAPAGQGVLPVVPMPILADLPIVGPILFRHQPLTVLAVAAVFLAHLLLFRTRWGLWTRAVGEHPRAADTVGISVGRVRCGNVLLGGALAGLGGAYFTLESVPHFEPLMTNGRGFITLAAMIFGNWTPMGAWGAALLFGLTEALPVTLQIQGLAVPYQLVGMLPYVLTIVVVAGAVGKAPPPAALGSSYSEEAR
jgi:general nucleoside transport system permease protein